MPSGLSAKVQTQFSGGNTACQQVLLEQLGVQNPGKGRKKGERKREKGKEGGRERGGTLQPKLHTVYKE